MNRLVTLVLALALVISPTPQARAEVSSDVIWGVIGGTICGSFLAIKAIGFYENYLAAKRARAKSVKYDLLEQRQIVRDWIQRLHAATDKGLVQTQIDSLSIRAIEINAVKGYEMPENPQIHFANGVWDLDPQDPHALLLPGMIRLNVTLGESGMGDLQHYSDAQLDRAIAQFRNAHPQFDVLEVEYVNSHYDVSSLQQKHDLEITLKLRAGLPLVTNQELLQAYLDLYSEIRAQLPLSSNTPHSRIRPGI